MSDQITKRTTTTTVVHVGGTPPADDDDTAWETVEVHFHGFEGLPSARDEHVDSPRFSCLGRKWSLELSPGGDEVSTDGWSALFLCLCSGSNGIELSCSLSVKNRDREQVAQRCNKAMLAAPWGEGHNAWGNSDFAERSTLLSSLDNGTLIVEVQMKQVGGDAPVPPFVTENPLCQNVLKRFNEEETADVVFEVASVSERRRGSRKKAKTAPATFYAHRLVLRDSATTLSELAKSVNDTSPIQIMDVKPEIFRHMLYFVYGGELSEKKEMETNAKELIDAADKYGVVNLKLKAEACYASSLELTVDNVLDNLLYADSKNCALLKEVVMDHIAENGKDILGKVSFSDVPGSVVTDLLTATTRREQNDNGDDDCGFETMRVSTLRKKLHEKGLDIDGSREAMIAMLKEHSS